MSGSRDEFESKLYEYLTGLHQLQAAIKTGAVFDVKPVNGLFLFLNKNQRWKEMGLHQLHIQAIGPRNLEKLSELIQKLTPKKEEPQPTPKTIAIVSAPAEVKEPSQPLPVHQEEKAEENKEVPVQTFRRNCINAFEELKNSIQNNQFDQFNEAKRKLQTVLCYYKTKEEIKKALDDENTSLMEMLGQFSAQARAIKISEDLARGNNTPLILLLDEITKKLRTLLPEESAKQAEETPILDVAVPSSEPVPSMKSAPLIESVSPSIKPASLIEPAPSIENPVQQTVSVSVTPSSATEEQCIKLFVCRTSVNQYQLGVWFPSEKLYEAFCQELGVLADDEEKRTYYIDAKYTIFVPDAPHFEDSCSALEVEFRNSREFENFVFLLGLWDETKLIGMRRNDYANYSLWLKDPRLADPSRVGSTLELKTPPEDLRMMIKNYGDLPQYRQIENKDFFYRVCRMWGEYLQDELRQFMAYSQPLQPSRTQQQSLPPQPSQSAYPPQSPTPSPATLQSMPQYSTLYYHPQTQPQQPRGSGGDYHQHSGHSTARPRGGRGHRY